MEHIRKLLKKNSSNQNFIIIAILRRSMQRVAKAISAAQRLDTTAPKKRRSGGDTVSI